MNPSLVLAQIIAQLQHNNKAHVTDTINNSSDIHESCDEDEELSSPTFDTYFDDDGLSSIKTMCRFMASNFAKFGCLGLILSVKIGMLEEDVSQA